MKKLSDSSMAEPWNTGMSKPVNKKGIVRFSIASSIPIREKPSGMSNAIGTVFEGTTVEILSKSEPGFYKVRVTRAANSLIIGYIPSYLLTEVE